ncbi:MAG: class I SAM-dependent methyltransferase [Myxococcales bacterium]|nr:MAG: class I SAM-dependent methyltransferase [Myxococcales bacterium]
MNQAQQMWQAFSEDKIVYRDHDIIVINKPENMPILAVSDGFPADVATRLKWALAEQSSAALDDIFLGVHQRLGQASSGLMVFSLSKEAQTSLSEQFEKRTVQERYRAVVALEANKKPFTGRVEQWLTRGKGGVTVVKAHRFASARKALCKINCVKQSAHHALLDIEIETEYSDPLRAVLASLGMPIVGDALCGAEAGCRLFLQAMELAFQHPISGKALRFELKEPADFESFFAKNTDTQFPKTDATELVLRAANRRWGIVKSQQSEKATEVFRLFNRDGDGDSRFALDVYKDWLVAHIYDVHDDSEINALLDCFDALGYRGVYKKVHVQKAHELADAVSAGLTPKQALRGHDAPEQFSVLEYGLPYTVRLGDGLGTGLYLDQRRSRKRVFELSRDKRVLNLFSHACAFGVAAGHGGATEVWHVDASKRLLEWGRDNVRLAGLGLEQQRFVTDDVFVFLKRLVRRSELFDVVILDPPTYSSVGKRRYSSKKDYIKLAEQCFSVLAPGGTLLACSNFSGMTLKEMSAKLRKAAGDAHRKISGMNPLPDPCDFPCAPLKASPYKVIEVRL